MEDNMTVDEIISTLNHSSLPTVIVEGKDDIIVYRKLESFGVDVLSAGGRNKVLEIFQRKNELSADKKIVFIADKDTWVNLGVPQEFIHDFLVLTPGYSIENEIFLDLKCTEILENRETINTYNLDRDKYIYWYALAVSRIGSGDPNLEIGKHPNEIINNYSIFESENYTSNYPVELHSKVREEYPLSIRGKSLIDLFIKHARGHTRSSIFDNIAARPGDRIKQLFEKVRALL